LNSLPPTATDQRYPCVRYAAKSLRTDPKKGRARPVRRRPSAKIRTFTVAGL